MIVSHKHRFIFIKTRKTASTSIEVFLSQVCGEDDIVTPFGKPSAGHQPRNWSGCYNHMPALEIKEHVGGEVWQNYFKFCFERNPWDKVVSYFYFVRGRFGNSNSLTIEELVNRGELPVDSPSYFLNGQLAVDRIGRYESLLVDLGSICEVIGIPIPTALPREKSQFRSIKHPYTCYFTDEILRQRVFEEFRWEVSELGYKFGQ